MPHGQSISVCQMKPTLSKLSDFTKVMPLHNPNNTYLRSLSGQTRFQQRYRNKLNILQASAAITNTFQVQPTTAKIENTQYKNKKLL